MITILDFVGNESAASQLSAAVEGESGVSGELSAASGERVSSMPGPTARHPAGRR
jgi:hypothetical protein